MKQFSIFGILAFLAMEPSVSAENFPIPGDSISAAFGAIKGTFVMVENADGGVTDSDPAASSEKLPPCSTFKIWNTLIGLETGVVSSPDEAFYHWDSEKRFIPEWNQNLTLKQAFQVSCVPAYQNLARKIGAEKMQAWLDRIRYGDLNTSSGIDVFWLPAEGRKTILISPREQVDLISRLVTGKLPFSAKSQAVLREIMLVKKTPLGALYGKTGTGSMAGGKYHLAWFVGYVQVGKKTYSFACASKGKGLTGKDSRTIVESILTREGYL